MPDLKITELSENTTPVIEDLLVSVDDPSGAATTKKITIGSLRNLILGAGYPVGSIYVNASDGTNPGTLLGFGTWAAHGAGRVMVGIDTGQVEFDVAEETGGAKTHVLVEAEMPAHIHGKGTLINASDSHTHTIGIRNNYGSQVDRAGGAWTGTNSTYNSGSDSHTHTISGSVASIGGNAAHNNLQPYIVVYIWKRTA